MIVGCAGPITAPNYQLSIDNVELLKKSGAAPLKAGQIGVTTDMPGAASLQMRAASMISPVGNNFGDYIATALKQELDLAKVSSSQSSIEVSGLLLKNNVDAGGLSTNSAQIDARFLVKRSGELLFDKVKKVEYQWESAFAGAVAIPLAVNNYPVIVQKLLNSLYVDPDFVTAIRP